MCNDPSFYDMRVPWEKQAQPETVFSILRGLIAADSFPVLIPRFLKWARIVVVMVMPPGVKHGEMMSSDSTTRELAASLD